MAAELAINAFDVSQCRQPTVVADPFVSSSGVVDELATRQNVPQRLLLMSHSRLLWYDVETGTVNALAEHRDARFRGAFVSDGARSLVALTTPDMSAESIFVEMLLPGAEYDVDDIIHTLNTKNVRCTPTPRPTP